MICFYRYTGDKGIGTKLLLTTPTVVNDQFHVFFKRVVARRYIRSDKLIHFLYSDWQ